MLGYARMMLGRHNTGGALDTQVVTSGSAGSAVHQSRRIGYLQNGRGAGLDLGSIADGSSALYAEAPITALYWDENGDDTISFVEFAVSGIQANSGWTQMVVDGTTTFLRADADFSNVANTYWTWTTPVSPFGANGSIHNVVFS